MDGLITSKVRQDILTQFIVNPGRRFYCRQLSRICGLSVAAVQEELKRLTEAGYLIFEPDGNKLYYEANRSHYLYPELLIMILKSKTIGPIVRDWLPKLGKVEQAFIYGSYARGDVSPYSDIDLMFVGEVDEDELAGLVRQLELSFLKEVNCTVYGRIEFERLQREGDRFLARVLSGPRANLMETEVAHRAV